MPRPAAAARRRVHALLKQEHKSLVAALRAVEDAADAAAQARTVEVALAGLERHWALENDAFYPAVAPAAQDRVDEAEVEHASMAALVNQIRAGGPSDPKFIARVKVLGEYLRHHAAEEEGPLFAALEAVVLPWDAIEQRLLGRLARAQKE